MVYRVYVEKKQGFLHEANSLLNDIKVFLGINSLQDLRVINRYDVENIEEELFNYAKKTVFSEPQVDNCYDAIDLKEGVVFAVEFFCIGITIKIHEWIKLNVPYPSKTLCDMIFLSMPKEIEDIINQYYVSKKELILVTESLR